MSLSVLIYQLLIRLQRTHSSWGLPACPSSLWTSHDLSPKLKNNSSDPLVVILSWFEEATQSWSRSQPLILNPSKLLSPRGELSFSFLTSRFWPLHIPSIWATSLGIAERKLQANNSSVPSRSLASETSQWKKKNGAGPRLRLGWDGEN